MVRVASTLVVAGMLFALSAGLAGARVSGPVLPPGWTHVSVNVKVKGTPETLTYDRGQITAVSGGSLTLRESDGSVWTINVSPSTTVTVNGAPSSLSQLIPRETAITVSVNGTATTVTARLSAALAASLARQQARAARQAARQGRSGGA